MNNFYYFFLLVFAVFISSLCQILLKKAAIKTYSSKIREYFNFQVISVYMIFLSVTLLSVICLRFIPLSYAVIIDLTGYIWVSLLSRLILKEKLTKIKLCGIILIILGIIITIL